MNNLAGDRDSSESRLRKQSLVSLACLILLVVVTWALVEQKPKSAASRQTPQARTPQGVEEQQQPVSAQTEDAPQPLQQLVAPIALYPDRLVAQILAAAAFPEQIVEANRWIQAHPELTGEAFTQAVDQQPWDDSVKALTALPAVLGNMDKNLAWTSSLGEAYSDDPGKVLDAIQTMRQRAKQAGTLKTTPQETVAMEDSNIAIQPASDDTVYVPQYNPWTAYGSPVNPWPDWYSYPGIAYNGFGCYFGPGYVIAFYEPFFWGWRHWGFDRHHRFVTHDNHRYTSRGTGWHHHEGNPRPNNAVASVNFAQRGLSARADSVRTLSAGGAGQQGLVVPQNLAANLQERGASAAFNGRREINNRPNATTNPAMGRIQTVGPSFAAPAVPRGYLAPPHRQFVTHSGALAGNAHGSQPRSVSAHSAPSGGSGVARGNAGMLHR